MVWVGFLGLWAPVPARGPQAEKKREEGKEGNGDARSSREPGDSRKEVRREVQQTGVAYIYIYIYKGPRSRQGVPGKEAERMGPDGCLSLWFGLAFWACGPRSPPEGPKQRRREKKERKATGTPEAAESQEIQGRKRGGKCNRRALHIYKGPRSRQGVPGKEAERMEPDGWLSLWSGFAFWACGPWSPPEGPKQRRREKEGRKATGTPEQQRARRFKEGNPGGSATDGRYIYIRVPVPGKGCPGKKQREWSRTVVCLYGLGWLFGLLGPGPRQRAPSREGERRREGRQRGRQKQQRARRFKEGSAEGSATDGRCIYIRVPVPGKGCPERKQSEWSRTVGCLYGLGLLFGLVGPGPRQRAPSREEERRREGRQRGRQSSREPGDSRKETREEVQQTGVTYI